VASFVLVKLAKSQGLLVDTISKAPRTRLWQSNAIIRPFGCAFEERRNEFCRIAFRKKLDASIKALLADLDEGRPLRQNGRTARGQAACRRLCCFGHTRAVKL
jgi:hypothetical protein